MNYWSRHSTVMVNSGETARLSCSVQASIIITIMVIVVIMVIVIIIVVVAVVIIIAVSITSKNQDSAEKHSVIWRNAAGDEVEEEGRWAIMIIIMMIIITVTTMMMKTEFISPQSERSELGAFYFCQGVLSGYCCVCVGGYCNGACYRGSSEMSQIHTQW